MWPIFDLFNTDPFRFVLIATIALCLLISFFTFYYFIYPRKPISPILALILISLLPVLGVFRSGTYQSGDLSNHAIFLASFYHSLSQGIWLPRWASEINFNFGNPMFLFIYPLPYYLGSFFHFFNLSYISSIKAVLLLTYLTSGIFTFAWAKHHFSPRGSLLAAIFYLFAPYHLIDMNLRVALGEMTAMMFIPVCLYFQAKLAKSNSWKNLFTASLGIAALLLSHQAISLITLPFLLSYGLLLSRSKPKYPKLSWLTPFILGLLLTSFYWFPVLVESRFTHEPLYSNRVEFAPFWQTLISPWQYGLLYQGHQGEMANIPGYIQVVLILVAGRWLLTGRKFKFKPLLKVCLVFFVFYFFLMQKISWPLWQTIPLIKNLQFAFRLNAVIFLTTSIIAAIIWENLSPKIKNKSLVVLLVAATIPTILNWGNRKMLPPYSDEAIDRSIFDNALFNPYDPATPKWLDPLHPWQPGFPNSPLESITGSTQVNEISRWGNTHVYQVNTQTPSLLKENTIYFPGWQVTVDGKTVGLSEQTYSSGIVHFRVPSGNHYIQVKFVDTWDRRLAKMVSLLTLGSLLMLKLGKLARSSNG